MLVPIDDPIPAPAGYRPNNSRKPSFALIPTRYPGSEASGDGLIALARKTEWVTAGDDVHHGLGQRLLATDADETPLMDIRRIAIDPATDQEQEPDQEQEQDG